jgi:hypothetical protein
MFSLESLQSNAPSKPRLTRLPCVFPQPRRFSWPGTTVTASSTRAKGDGRLFGRAWTGAKGTFAGGRNIGKTTFSFSFSFFFDPDHEHASRRRDGQGLSAKAPVKVPKVEGAPERGKPYWSLMDPKEAGKLWRKQYGDKVPEVEAESGETKPSGTLWRIFVLKPSPFYHAFTCLAHQRD